MVIISVFVFISYQLVMDSGPDGTPMRKPLSSIAERDKKS